MTLLTENEAAEKWCPLGRHVPEFSKTVGAGTAFRSAYDTPSQGNRCIGSRCMAWRWTRAGMVFEVTEDRGAIFRSQKVDDTAYGYCGAFGKIEP